jgi:hypothetical protein
MKRGVYTIDEEELMQALDLPKDASVINVYPVLEERTICVECITEDGEEVYPGARVMRIGKLKCVDGRLTVEKHQ